MLEFSKMLKFSYAFSESAQSAENILHAKFVQKCSNLMKNLLKGMKQTAKGHKYPRFS